MTTNKTSSSYEDLDFPHIQVDELSVPAHLIPNEQMIRNFRINSGLPVVDLKEETV